MTKNFDESISLFNSFLQELEQKDIDFNSSISPHGQHVRYYATPYKNFMANFLHEVSGIPIDFIKQFVTLNQFSSLISNLEKKISLTVAIHEKFIDIRLGDSSKFYELFNFRAYKNKAAYISCTHRNLEIKDGFSYDDAYNMILNEVSQKISPDIINSSVFLRLHEKSHEEIIQQKLKSSNHRYISHDKFCEVNRLDKKKGIIDVEKTLFLNFLKDSFSTDSYHKLLQIISLVEFDAYISNKSITQSKISFPTVSKFLKFNTLVSLLYLDFGLMFDDNGSFYYENPILDVPVYLEDLDEIYNHLLKEFLNKISRVVEIPVEQLTSRNIEMYKIVVY